MFEAIIGIVGVFLGFGLAVGYQEYKELRARKQVKDALLIELRSTSIFFLKRRTLPIS